MLATAIITLAAASAVRGAAIERSVAVESRAVAYNPVVFNYPTPRGWNAETATQGPCGGLSQNADAVTTYPLTIGQIALTYNSDIKDLQLNWAPTDKSGDASAYKPFKDQLDYAFEGTGCYSAPRLNTDLGLDSNQTITLQATYKDDGVTYYSCADLFLVSYHLAPVSTVACVDSVKTTDGELVDNAKIEGAANAASSDSGLTPAEAGGVGAGVTIGVIGLVAAAAAFMGLLHFGKKAKVTPAPRTDDSSDDYPQKTRQ